MHSFNQTTFLQQECFEKLVSDLLLPLKEEVFILQRFPSFSVYPSPSAPLCQLVSLFPAIPDGALDMAICADETGSEEDLYEDMHSSSHHYSHSGGGGEQLAINEVGSGLCG